jgi:peptidylprolyl isomerase
MKLIRKSFPLLLIAFTGLFSSCNNKSNSDATPAPAAVETPAAAPAAQDDANWANEDGLYAVFNTKKGKIVCKLEYQKAPLTVGNFVSLTEGNNPMCTVNKGKPFYDGLTFHRVEPGFVIQGGDPAGNGSGGPGYKFANEVDPTLKHSKAGTLAMANAGPNTNGSQFYITLAPTAMLDGGYSVFGYVVSGQSVVNSIAIGDKMDSVRIVRVGADAKACDGAKTFTTAFVAAKKKLDDAASVQLAAWDTKVKAKFPTAQKTASGLYYVIDKAGTGALPKKGQTVVAHYTGTLWDGTKFDSSKDHGKPFEFAVGQHQVIEGWDEGFALLKVGTKGKLIIPSRLAYGERGTPGGPIGPNADLIFDVEMLGVK